MIKSIKNRTAESKFAIAHQIGILRLMMTEMSIYMLTEIYN